MRLPENIYARDLMKEQTLTITIKMKGMKRFLVCLWLGKQLISLGAWISGIGTTEFKEE